MVLPLLGLKEQIKSSLMPFRKLRDRMAYSKGLTPELKYVARKVSGVKRADRLESPL